MRRDSWIATGVAIGLMIGTAIFLGQAKVWQRLGDPGVKITSTPLYDAKGKKAADTSVALPERILGAEAKALPISQAELDMLPQDTLFGRKLYSWPERSPIQINVVLMGADRTSIHRPEYCLSGQGWVFKESEIELLGIKMLKPAPYELPVMKIVASSTIKHEGQDVLARGIYLYWYVNDREITARQSGHMWTQAKHLVLKGEMQRWAYIAFFSTCLPGQEAETFEWMKLVIVESVPEFQLPPAVPQQKSTEGKTEMGMAK